MTDDKEQICDLIEQVLATCPGERVNQPDFGVDLQQFVFEPNNAASRAAIQNAVKEALNRWLGNIIEVEEVEVTREASSISVLVVYKVLDSNELRCDVFIQDSY